jgi:hypothetical protein
MQPCLLEPGGVYRALHSATALRDFYLRRAKWAAFGTAYRYLCDRMAFLRYSDYRRWGVPWAAVWPRQGARRYARSA